ncbi:MAG: hypothetical protein ABIL09_15950 [Gemmatimonadota bacterium]
MGTAAAEGAPAAVDAFLAALDQGLARQQLAVGEWTPAAEAAVTRFLAGGRLMVGGPAPDFAAEAMCRSGGLMPLSSLAGVDSPGPRDVALLGFSGPEPGDVDAVRRLAARGVLTIGFGERAARGGIAAACAHWIDSQAPAPAPGVPLPGILDVASLWTFTGELVAACTRAGAMPAMWQCAMLPGAEARNRRYAGTRLHEDQRPPPVPPTGLGAAYLAELRHCVAGFTAGERGRLREAGEVARRARRGGGHAWFLMAGGHLRAAALALPGALPGFERLDRPPDPTDLAAVLQPGDFLYVQGYVDPPAGVAEAAHAAGARVCVSSGRRGGPPPAAGADLRLDAQWVFGDAAVPVPGYDVPILPPSGFMAAAVYWALVIEAQPSS